MNRNERRASGKTGESLRAARELMRQGHRGDAATLYHKILKKDPRCLPALVGLGLLSSEDGDFAAADIFLARAAALAPMDPVPLSLLATVKMNRGDIDGAVDCAKKALALPPSVGVLQRMGSLLREAGKFELAQECFERVIRLQPDCVPAYFSLGTLRKFGAADPIFQQLLKLGDRADSFPVEERAALHFALGRAFTDQGDADKGFLHFAEGNRLKRSIVSYDADVFERHIDNIIALFNAQVIKQHAGQGHASARPIFIVGMPRSGSTLIDQILSSHAEVRSAGEIKALGNSMPVLKRSEPENMMQAGTPGITKELMEGLGPEMLQGIAKRYLAATDPFAKDAPRLVDKMLYNYLWIGMIRLAFPNAKIIHCTRDPMDAGLSIWQLLFSEGSLWAYDQREIGRYYLAYRRLMGHWKRLFPGDILEANYEKMVADQEGETRRLLDFCGLPWDPRCLNFHENSRTVGTWSATQVRQPIYKDAVQKWRKYEKHLQVLIDAIGAPTP